MSKILPKRTRDLFPIDSDADTPDKRVTIPKKPVSILPKRTKDLNLNISFDSDDGCDKKDTFNTANFLNDSIVFSPSKDPDLLRTPTVSVPNKKNDKENFKQPEVLTSNGEDSGFLSRITSMQLMLSVEAKIKDDKPLFRPLIKSRTQLFSDASQSSKMTEGHHKEEPPSRVFPIRKPLHDTRPPLQSYKAEETPQKEAKDYPFATPSTRNFPTMRNPLSTVDRDMPNKQPKIIFSTPAAKLSPPKQHGQPTLNKVDENLLVINKVEYLIDKKIGHGGSSSVHLARGRKSGKEVAIKIVKLDDGMAESYINETKLLASLQRNINVVELYDYYHAPEKKLLYLVMEKGESDLQTVLNSYHTHIPLYELMKYWHQMLQAVNYIHKRNVIHSDLKPANFLMVNGRLKLIDFGIASSVACDATSVINPNPAGTYSYVSPEALIDTGADNGPSKGCRISTRSDVWSLGCILYYLIYSRTPLSHIKQTFSKVAALINPQTVISYPPMEKYYPPMLLEMVQRCLTYNPKMRPSCEELLAYPFDMVIRIEQ